MVKCSHDNRRALYDAGLNDAKIAQALGLTSSSIGTWRRANGLPKRPRLSGEGQDSRQTLYDRGLNDVEIARELGVSRNAVFQWRKCRGIPPIMQQCQPTSEQHEARQDAYDKGLTDVEIGELVNIPPEKIRGWRRRRNLSSHTFLEYLKRRAMVEGRADRLELYRRGMSDKKIAHEERVGVPAVVEWRQRRNLLPNSVIGVRSERHILRLSLYNREMTDRQIAQIFGSSLRSIIKWRYKYSLPAHRCPAKQRHRKHPAVDYYVRTHPLLDRIRSAIGHYLARDIADDAVGEMVLAILSGDVKIEEVEQRAKSFASRAFAQYASRYGPRSIDEVVPGTEDFRLIDTLRDHHSRDWLEEMGATVW